MKAGEDTKIINLVIYCTFVLVLSISAFFYVYSISVVIAIEPDSGLYGKDSNPFNLSRAEWLTKYWNWTASIPKSEHPRFDTTGQNCDVNQHGPVWFLDGPVNKGTVTRSISCTIPTDKAVYVPLLSGECDYSDTTIKTDAQVTSCAKEGNDGGNIKLYVDGKPLVLIKGTSQSQNDYSNLRVTSDFFKIHYNSSNVWDLPAGNYRARADGYPAILMPFPPGQHTINLQTNVQSPYTGKSGDYDYILDMTWKLNVTNNTSH